VPRLLEIAQARAFLGNQYLIPPSSASKTDIIHHQRPAFFVLGLKAAPSALKRRKTAKIVK
jgi:hypothetical protein